MFVEESTLLLACVKRKKYISKTEICFYLRVKSKNNSNNFKKSSSTSILAEPSQCSRPNIHYVVQLLVLQLLFFLRPLQKCRQLLQLWPSLPHPSQPGQGGAGRDLPPDLPRIYEPPIHLKHYNYEGLKPRARHRSVFTDVSLNVSVASLIFPSPFFLLRAFFFLAEFLYRQQHLVCLRHKAACQNTCLGVWVCLVSVQDMCAAHKVKVKFFKSLCANFDLHYRLVT